MFKVFSIFALINSLTLSCKTPMPEEIKEGVQLPFIKNSSNECYYLDEFMPIPDSLVSGRNGQLRLRYYTYKSASYKDFTNQQIILSFYSSDETCWSLFEEYYIKD